MGNPNTGALAFQKDVVYLHQVKPTAKLNNFQQIIQRVQRNMGFSMWETTHVFATLNDKIIDRTGVYTVSSQQEAIQYLKDHYAGHEIHSFGSSDVNLIKNFNALHKKISTIRQRPIFVEEPFTGEYMCADVASFQPYNSIYGLGKETAITIKDVFALQLKKIKISEKDAIASALEAGTRENFKESTRLINPTYCSLTVGELITSLQSQPILRYPALTHSFLQACYEKFNMSYVKTTIN